MNQPVNGRLADEPEREAGNGDSELTGSDTTVEVGDRSQERSGPGPLLVHQFLDPRSADRDQRELGRDEEPVDRDEYRNGDQPDDQKGRAEFAGLGEQ